jgi:hypothetical protein
MNKLSPDLWIQWRIMAATWLGLLGCFFASIDSRYTHADVTAERVIKRAVIDAEVRDELRGMHEEINQIYMKMIPEAERHHGP